MKYVFLSFVSILLGFAIGISLERNSGKEAPGSISEVELSAEKERYVIRVEDLESELRLTNETMASLELELEELREWRAVREASVAEEVEAEADEATNPFMEMVRAVSASSTESHNRKELNKLKNELGLNAEQVEKIQAFFEQDGELQTAIIESAMQGGTFDYEAMEAEAEKLIPDREYAYIGELLDDILTPEQQELYGAMQEREAEERREATAYRELARIQQSLKLSEEQKDVVFAVHYENAHKVEFAEWESLGIDADDRSSWLKVQAVEHERLLEALADELSPEQLDQYRFQLEEDLQMQRNMHEVMRGDAE